MKKIALTLVIILTFMWLSGCTQRSSPTFKESDFVYMDLRQAFLLNQINDGLN